VCSSDLLPNHSVDAEGFALEERRARHVAARVLAPVIGGIDPSGIDSKRSEELLRYATISPPRRIDGLGTSVPNQRTSIDHELVALGMATEIVVRLTDPWSRRLVHHCVLTSNPASSQSTTTPSL
jgi:hypothetical protein